MIDFDERDVDFIVDEAEAEGQRPWAFHDECGYAWAVHDNHDPLNKLPFGCPHELSARERWGR